MIPTCNTAGRALIRAAEGLRLKAYRCPAGFLTIGYGHTVTTYQGQTITEAEAERLLDSDLKRYEGAIASLVRVPLTSNQFSALVCLSFNIGIAAFTGSSLRKLLNRGWYDQVPAQIKRWNKAHGRVLSGLTQRRAAEAELWKMPDTLTPPTQEKTS